MGDFEFDIELLISLVEAGPVLWYKSDDIYKVVVLGPGSLWLLLIS